MSGFISPPSVRADGLPEGLTGSAEMRERLDAATQRVPWITTEVIGRSVEGKDLIALRAKAPAEGDNGEVVAEAETTWKVLFIGAQHGNEHAGKEAILDLIDDLAAGEIALPTGVELWAVPMANPDGVDRDERRNANDVDLNRDHLILSQPETVALHKLVQRERPHVIVDGHEFTRDSKSYTEKGWGEWPLIMMDGANSPLLPDAWMTVSEAWVDAARRPMRDAGFNFLRYTIGGPPPTEELRFSTLDADDARNGLSFYGGVGFIIESGVMRAADDPQADLPERVAAYRLLLERFVADADRVEATRSRLALAHRVRAIPVNVFWASTESHQPSAFESDDARYRVIDLASGEMRAVSAYNVMGQRVVKRSVPVPAGYAVPPGHADAYADLLEKHAVAYERLDAPRTVAVERANLDRLEEDFDEVYERYGGRQVVSVEADAEFELPVGSLWIDLARLAEEEPMMARRAIKVLEPQQLYGLYQWPAWRATVAADGTIPVVRVMAE